MRGRTLAPGPIAFDSKGIAIHLRSSVNDANMSGELCIGFDTSRYVFLSWRTLTVRERRPSDASFWPTPPPNEETPDSTAISLAIQLEGGNGERAEFDRVSSIVGSGEMCTGSTEVRPGVFYTKLSLRSTKPVVVRNVTWWYRPHNQ
jgi:hypothetical protein